MENISATRIGDYFTFSREEIIARKQYCDMQLNSLLWEIVMKWGGIPLSYLIIATTIYAKYSIGSKLIFGIGLSASFLVTMFIRFVSGHRLFSRIACCIWKFWIFAGLFFLLTSAITDLKAF